MNIDNAISILESNNIKYEIKYKETEDYENNTIISQSPDSGKKLTEEDKVTLTVAKKTNQNKETEENTKTDQSTEEETNNSETNEQEQNSE